MRATTNPFAPWRSVNSEPEEDWVANAKEAEAGEKLEGIMERKKFLVWKGGRSEEDDEKVAEFLKEFDVRDEESARETARVTRSEGLLWLRRK